MTENLARYGKKKSCIAVEKELAVRSFHERTASSGYVGKRYKCF